MATLLSLVVTVLLLSRGVLRVTRLTAIAAVAVAGVDLGIRAAALPARTTLTIE